MNFAVAMYFQVGGPSGLREDNYNTQLLGSQNDMATIRLVGALMNDFETVMNATDW